jgi:hypothetical protein
MSYAMQIDSSVTFEPLSSSHRREPGAMYQVVVPGDDTLSPPKDDHLKAYHTAYCSENVLS